jgi:hypothetical protein
MSKKTENSIIELISKTIQNNYDFFDSNSEIKEVISEIVELTNDAIDFIPLNKDVSFEQIFSFHGFTPLSYGIFVSLLSGNLPSCFSQLRILIEFYAMMILSKKNFPEDDSFTQMKKIQKQYRKNTSKMMKECDPKIYELWKSLSSWMHGITYSRKAVRNVIKGQVSQYHMIHPALYDKKDFEQLFELKFQIRAFRKIIQEKNNNS